MDGSEMRENDPAHVLWTSAATVLSFSVSVSLQTLALRRSELPNAEQ